jgi:hypothetical protein
MEGQISDSEFRSLYPNAKINNSDRTCITRYGRSTINYWMQHDDGSWTNYDCKTI